MSLSDVSYIESLLPFYKEHAEKVIPPFWLRTLDHQNGGIYTFFDNTGRELISRDKFTWSQGRYLLTWLKVAAMTAENRLEGDMDYNPLAEKALFNAVNKGWDVEFGGLFRFVDSDGGKPKSGINELKLKTEKSKDGYG